MWTRPTLECYGVCGGYQGPGGKTNVPSFAHAKLCAHLVAGQEPEHIESVVTEHLKRVAPPRVTIESDGDVRAVGILHLPQVLIGVGLPDDAIHAPNKKFDLHQFCSGIETMAFLYDELAEALNT